MLLQYVRKYYFIGIKKIKKNLINNFGNSKGIIRFFV